jgi:regulator of protease activity HflC (stomatin/prohibitin superfamily)
VGRALASAHAAAVAAPFSSFFSRPCAPSALRGPLRPPSPQAQFDADQLLTQRESVSRSIRESLNARAAEFHIYLEDVSITHLMFSKEFTMAIESKQVAQQDAERSKFVVLKAEQERQAAIIRAEGESEAARLISSALRKAGTAVIDVRRIDAAKQIADVLSRSRNVVYVPGGGGAGAGGAPQMLMAMPQPQWQKAASD